jgi:lipopolysaccharide biosynthesis glycosyltransferase
MTADRAATPTEAREGWGGDVRRVVVACAADGPYALPLAVMLRSAESRLDPAFALEVYAVDGGLSPEQRDRIERSLGSRVELHWVAPERSAFAGLPLWGRMPIATYDKLGIGRWVPSSIDKVLWLDADVLVLGDLADLWRTADGSDAVLRATQDDRVPTVASRFGVTPYASLGLVGGAKYFNAGVMAVNLARWRAAEVEDAALSYLRRHRDRVYFWDQEALNVALAGRWEELSPVWNWNPSNGGLDRPSLDAATAPRILHFSGYLKPWRYESRSAAHDLYYRDLDRTAWAGWRPDPSWWARGIATYESSRLRRFGLPLERFGLTLVRATTLRYASAADLVGDDGLVARSTS